LSFFHESGGKTSKKKFVRGAGCNFCAQTGYLGRVGIYELLIISDSIKQMVVEHVGHDHLRAQAIKEGLHTLLQDAMEKIDEDQTTIGEVLRKMYVA
jgi:type IV pilus assembly protein PilB